MTKLEYRIKPKKVYASLDEKHPIIADFTIQLAKKDVAPLWVKAISIQIPLGADYNQLSADGTLPPPVTDTDSDPNWTIELIEQNTIQIKPKAPVKPGDAQSFTRPISFRLPGVTINRAEGPVKVAISVSTESGPVSDSKVVEKLANSADQVSFYADPPSIHDLGDETTLHIKGPREYHYRVRTGDWKTEVSCDGESGTGTQECELAVKYPVEKDTDFELDVVGLTHQAPGQLLNTLSAVVKVVRPSLALDPPPQPLKVFSGQTVNLDWTATNADSVTVCVGDQVADDHAPIRTGKAGYILPIHGAAGQDIKLSVTAYSPKRTLSAQQEIALSVVATRTVPLPVPQNRFATDPRLFPLTRRKQAFLLHDDGVALVDLSDVAAPRVTDVLKSLMGAAGGGARLLSELPMAVSSDSKFALVYSWVNQISVVHEITDQGLRERSACQARVLAAAPDGGWFYVLLNPSGAGGPSELARYDPGAGAFLPAKGSAPLKISPPAWRSNYPVTPDGRYLLTSDGGNLVCIDLQANTVARTVALPGSPSGIAITPDSTQAWVCMPSDNSVGVVDISKGVLDGDKIPMAGAWDVAVTEDGQRALVCSGSAVAAFDVAHRRQIGSVGLRPRHFARDVVVLPDGLAMVLVENISTGRDEAYAAVFGAYELASAQF